MSELDDVLARLVDAHGLHKVCTALMVVCYSKAEQSCGELARPHHGSPVGECRKGHGRHIAACGYCKPCTALATHVRF